MKNLRNFVVLFSIVLGAVAANAQTTVHGTFRLANEARWGKAVLPAGQYKFTMDSVQSPIVIRSVNGKAAAIVRARSSNDPTPGGSYLFITGSGPDRLVRSMNLPQFGISLVFNPLTAGERETLYAHSSETVQVQIAKK